MSRTVAQMAQVAIDYVDMPSDPEALAYAISGIYEGIDNLNMMSWNFMLTVSGFRLAASTTDYSFPSGIRAPRHMSLLNGTNREPVGYLDPKSFYQERPDFTTGTPDRYTVIGNTVRFGSTPDSTTITTWPSGEFIYFQRIATPTSTSSSIGVPGEVESLLIDYARAFVAERYDNDKIANPTRRWEVGIKRLRINDNLSQLSDWSES